MNDYMKLEHISKRFGEKVIFDDLTLDVARGETVGIVGENGSGKSVLFKLLCGLECPDAGCVITAGRRLKKSGEFPQEVGIFINSPAFIGIYSGYQNLKFLADIRAKIGEREIRSSMQRVGLDPDNRTRVDNYSLGMKQKLGLAQAIMEEQEILILDEPFNALDFRTYEDMKEIIRELKAEGRTIFLTSHHYRDIELLCDRIYMIEAHRLVPLAPHYSEQKNQRPEDKHYGKV